MIISKNGKYYYYDRNGSEITAGCQIRYMSGEVETVYETDNGELGTDATNKEWIKKGIAAPCEYGIYPLTQGETNSVLVIHQSKEGNHE